MTGTNSRTLWRLTKGFRYRYALAIGALIIGTFFGYLPALVSRTAIDAIVGSPEVPEASWSAFWLDQLGGAPTLRARLWLAAILIATFALAGAVFMHLKDRWTALAAEGVVRRLRDRLYDHLQRLPCQYHDQAETGDLVQRCTSDVETVHNFLSLQVVEIGRALLLLVTVIPIMLLLDGRMTAVSLAGTPLIVAFSTVFFLKIKPAFLRMDEAEGRMTTVLQENLTGIRVVRAFARQEHECQKFALRNRDFRDRNYHLIVLVSIFWPLSDLLVFGQLAAVLLTGAYWVGVGQLSVGTLVAFVWMVDIYIWPIRLLGRILTDLGKALVSLGRINEILSVAPEMDPTADAPRDTLQGRVEFCRVTFGYAPKTPVLHDVSFAVEPGQTLAFLGPSGAGKSTIVNLLLRLYDYDAQSAGSIRLDGIELTTLPRQWLRTQISVVLQEPFLYSKTLRENIVLGRRDAEEHEVFEAARMAHIHDTIDAFEQGYETLVGERGLTLSGGQRQRVALARALLQRPAILVLDDALSSVDTRTEALILRALRERHGRQTTIVIAHRLSTLRQADQIIVFDEGRIVQSGTHESLWYEPGLYRRLWEIQGVTVE